MESWIKGIAALLAGVLALVWQPGLESAQNSIISSLHVSGPVVTLVWLALVFAWVFLLASIAHAASATLLFYLEPWRWHPSLQRHDE